MTAPVLRAAGTSEAAIAQHYDLPVDFFRLWLGTQLTYSCALWADGDNLDRAQQRKLDWFATRLDVRDARVLDVGCGWGALLDRFAGVHGTASGVGLTLSAAQAETAAARHVPGIEYRQQSWVDHEPAAEYDAITAIESTEHLASDRLGVDDKVDVYRAFFARLASWLRDDGRVGLQLICLDGVGHEGSRPGRGPMTRLIGTQIFPDAMSSSLAEMVLGWETHFQLLEFVDHTSHYVRTFRAWAQAFRRNRAGAEEIVGPDTAKTFASYFAAGEVMFRLREQALYRAVLVKRARPKVWVAPVQVSALREPGSEPSGAGASAPAIRAHYDVSNAFYATWLGPSMLYSSGMWSAGDPPDLDSATARKIDYFATRVLPGPGARVLDVGCGWGGVLRRLADRHGVRAAVGLTLSPAQQEFIAADPVPDVEIRIQDWAAYAPPEPFDAIFSFGAFEHFARDGMTGLQRVERYRRFFGRCHEWLRPDGRVAIETIFHDGAPDTAGMRGRGPLGDSVLELFPESLCPHLSEVVLGFEPWFEVEILRSDPADFARTFRAWQVALRANRAAAKACAGADTVRRFRRYLAASEIQFRDGTLSNLRLVLHRRAELKR